MLEFLKQWLMRPRPAKPVQPRYTEEELMVRLKVFIGACLALTLFGIVFVVLYSLIFVTQPMNGMSPVDNKFFELIIPVATFLTGTLSGIMLGSPQKKEDMANPAAPSPQVKPTIPTLTPPVAPVVAKAPPIVSVPPVVKPSSDNN